MTFALNMPQSQEVESLSSALINLQDEKRRWRAEQAKVISKEGRNSLFSYLGCAIDLAWSHIL